VGNTTDNVVYPRERDTVTIVQETGWVPGPVWTGAENLVTTRIRSPDRKETIDAQTMLMYKLIVYEYEDICVGNYCNDVGVPG
jgi:hypothetical protein